MLEYDIVIVGAGPAGSAAALKAASEGKKVLVIERGPEPGSKNVSGAMIRKNYVTSVFGEGMPFERNVETIKLSLYNKNKPVDIEFHPEGLVTTGRLKFDKWLSSVSESAGAMVITKTTALKLNWEDGIAKSLTTDRGDVAAKSFILAEGVNALVSMESGINGDWTPANSVQAVKMVYSIKKGDLNTIFGFPDDNTGMAARMIMSDPLVAGFMYTYKDSLAVGIGSPIKELLDRKISPEKLLDEFLEKTGIAEKVKGYSLREYSAKVIPEGGFPDSNVAKGNVYLCGDAIGLVDPLTFDGITPAIASGTLAAEAAVNNYSKEIYRYNLMKDPEISKIAKERKLEADFMSGNKAGEYMGMVSTLLEGWASGDLIGIRNTMVGNYRNIIPDLMSFVMRMR
ncbi:NAD(P)/FAD-dependent oxidoreductase [Ferroplasma sp.]|uniref:NAD(P)/FAD-dependent oxidoreductase n=1 Tax=Ferroplasma sp. TaxID=2591003 RepID=UPI00307DA9DD